MGAPVRVQVLPVSGMPFGTEVWIDDSEGTFTVYVDAALITKRGALLLSEILTSTVADWQRNEETVHRILRAVAG